MTSSIREYSHFFRQAGLLPRLPNSCASSGYSLIEVVTVLFILGILSSITLPAVTSWIRLSQVDEAKALLNGAIAECLRETRTNPNWKSHIPRSLADRTLPGKYEYKNGLNTCEQVYIHDPSSESSFFLDLGFIITGERVIKEAINKRSETQKACESWGNCGGSPSAKYLIECSNEKDTCQTSLSKLLATAANGTPGKAWTGQCVWPADPTCGCNRDVWVCEKQAKYSREEYDACIRAKSTKACNDHRDNLAKSNFSGNDPAGQCPEQSWWWEGKDVGSEASWKESICSRDVDSAINSGKDGPVTYSVAGCNAKWICKGEKLDDVTSYDDKCPPPPPPPVYTPPPVQTCRIRSSNGICILR